MTCEGVSLTTGATFVMRLRIEPSPALFVCTSSSMSASQFLPLVRADSLFASILPALAYTLDMYRRTGHFFGVNEALFSSALAAMVFSIFGCQPLTIVGITGLISLFNETIFEIIIIYDPAIYPQFMAWVGIWGAIFHWLVAVCNICDYMRYVTDFSSESFGMYVGIIYCSKLFLRPPVGACPKHADLWVSQGRRGARRRVHKDRPYRWLHERDDRHLVLYYHLPPRKTGQ